MKFNVFCVCFFSFSLFHLIEAKMKAFVDVFSSLNISVFFQCQTNVNSHQFVLSFFCFVIFCCPSEFIRLSDEWQKKTMEMKSQIDFYLFLCCFSTSFLCFVVDILPFHENNEEETRRSTLWRRCFCSRVDETTEQKSNILIAFMWVIMCMGVCVCLEATEQICFFCSCNFSKIHRFPFIMWI